MSAYSKHAWLAFGVSFIAGTAHASIPDQNGVIHGCYSVLSGAARIVSGGCGLFEQAVTWEQTGPQGPAGESVTGVSLDVGDANCPAGGVALTLAGVTSYICNGEQGPPGPSGPQGPVGPSGSADIVLDSVNLTYSTGLSGQPFDEIFLEDRPVESDRAGKCIYTLTGTGPGGTPTYWFRGQVLEANSTALAGRAVMQEAVDVSGSKFTAGTVTTGFDVEPGKTYYLGIHIESAQPSTDELNFQLGWTCKFDPPAT